MGYRSTLISEHVDCKLPDWFKVRWGSELEFFGGSMIASKGEFKLYGGRSLFEDYQKALIEGGALQENRYRPLMVVVLGEDGVVSKVDITKETIVYHMMNEDEQIEMEGVFNQWQ